MTALSVASRKGDSVGIEAIAQECFDYAAAHSEYTFGAGVAPVRRRGKPPVAARALRDTAQEVLRTVGDELVDPQSDDGDVPSPGEIQRVTRFSTRLAIRLMDLARVLMPGNRLFRRPAADADNARVDLVKKYVAVHRRQRRNGKTIADLGAVRLAIIALVACELSEQDAENFFAAKEFTE